MEIIKILPHHAIRYFEVFYLGRNAEDLTFYDEHMKRESVERIKRVVENPN